MSTERIRDEFSKILTADRPDLGLNLLVQLPLLQHFIPELLSCVDFEQNAFHTADVFTHTLAVVRSTSPQLTLRLAALFHDIAKPLTLSVDPTTGERHFYCHEVGGADLCENILTRLKYPSQLVRDVVTLVRTHMRPIEAGAGGLRRLIRDTGELFPLWRELKSCDTLACKVDSAHFADRLSRFDEQIAEVKRGPELSPLSSLAVDGHDLLAFGMKEGPEVGITLRALHELVLDNPQLNDKETLLKLVRDGAMTRPAS